MANDWISVNDRLPEPDRVVLVIVSGKPCENITLENALELAWWYESDGWVLETWPEWDGAEVTHWMPAPELPQVGCGAVRCNLE